MNEITAERLASIIADQEQFAAWTDDPEENRDALEIVAALRELQQWRSGVEPGTGAPIGRFVVIDPWTDETD